MLSESMILCMKWRYFDTVSMKWRHLHLPPISMFLALLGDPWNVIILGSVLEHFQQLWELGIFQCCSSGEKNNKIWNKLIILDVFLPQMRRFKIIKGFWKGVNRLLNVFVF